MFQQQFLTNVHFLIGASENLAKDWLLSEKNTFLKFNIRLGAD